VPISDKPVTLSFNKGGPGSKLIASLLVPKAPAQTSLGFSAEDFTTEDGDAEAATSVEDNKGSSICSQQLSEYELTFVLWQ
jgi:RNA-binding protein 5/10